ncbi:MAG: T9SS type A sorting domain-containing protein [Flavobacteriales bacterium]|nr:T9SS type A sorting domain-containing protein [Flavobacteriales bacterium]
MKRSYTIATALLATSTLFAQSAFQRVLPGEGWGWSVVSNSTGDVFVGVKATDGAGTPVNQVVKYDVAGALQWSTKLLVPSAILNNAYLLDLATTAAGGVVVTGNSSISFGDSVYVAKLDADGAVLWALRLVPSAAGVFHQLPVKVAEATNGDVVLCGVLQVLDGGGGFHDDSFIARFSSSGTHLWTKRVTTAAPGQFNRISAMLLPATGGIVLAGSTANNAGSWLMRLDDAGGFVWAKRYGISAGFPTWPSIGVIPAASGFSVYFQPTYFGGDTSAVYRVNVDPLGSVVSAKSYHTFDPTYRRFARATASANGHLLAGRVQWPSGTGLGRQAMMLSIAASGAAQWAMHYGSSGIEEGLSATSTADGGHLLVGFGELDSLVRGGNTVSPYLVKTNATGEGNGCEGPVPFTDADLLMTDEPYAVTLTDITGWQTLTLPTSATYEEVEVCGINGLGEEQSSGNLQLFPNPVDRFFILTSTVPFDARTRVVVHDALGQNVNVPFHVEQNSIEVDAAALTPGAYSITLYTSGNSITRRFVKH